MATVETHDVVVRKGMINIGVSPNGRSDRWSWLRSRTARSIVGIAIIAFAFAWALPSFASYSDVWAELTQLRTSFVLVIAAVGAANLIAPAVVQRSALPGLRLNDAVTTDWVTSAITNTVPGGSALAIGMTWTMYRSFSLGTGAIARSIVVTGVWDTFVKLGSPLLAVIWLSTERPVGPGLIQAALVGGALFVVVIALGFVLLAGSGAADTLGRFLDRLRFLRSGWPARLGSLRTDTLELLRDRWAGLTFWTIAGHANLYLLLLVCLRAVGVTSTEASPAAVLAALAFGRLVTALPVSPGGLGVLEVSLTGALAAVGSADEATVVAAVLLFRSITFLLPIPLGAVGWLIWNNRSARGLQQRV